MSLKLLMNFRKSKKHLLNEADNSEIGSIWHFDLTIEGDYSN